MTCCPGCMTPSRRGRCQQGTPTRLARVTRDLDDAGRSQLQELEATLVESAATSSVEAFERQVRDLGRILSRDDGVANHERLRRQRSLRRWVDRNTGMCHTHLQLDPEADAKVSAALDAAIAAERATPDDAEGRSFDQLKADAMVTLITGARSRDRRIPEVTVLIDLDTLRHGLHDTSICESGDGQPLPPATVRRLCCEAAIVPVVLNGTGASLDVGRDQRLATRAQRRALRAMYRTCAHPGCPVRFADCDIHHVIDWDHHGPTNLANLLPLCSRHHHLVHEGGWQLSLHPDRTITLHRPDGTLHYDDTTIDVAPTGLPHSDTDITHIVELARTRARNLGPPARAPPPEPTPPARDRSTRLVEPSAPVRSATAPGGGLRGLPGVDSAPDVRDDHGAEERADDSTRLQREPVTEQQAQDQTADERADETGDEGHAPVDAATGPSEDHLGRGTDDHAQKDDGEDQHEGAPYTRSSVGGTQRSPQASRSAAPKTTRLRVAMYRRSRSTPASAICRARSASTPGTVLDVDDDDLTLACHGEVGDTEHVLRRGSMGNEDVQFGPFAVSDARRRGDVDAGVADRGGDPRQRPWFVVHVDHQIHGHGQSSHFVRA